MDAVESERKLITQIEKITLKDVLLGQTESPLDVTSFRTFAAHERSTENIDFWLEAQRVQMEAAQSNRLDLNECGRIVDKFAASNAPAALNIDGLRRRRLVEAMSQAIADPTTETASVTTSAAHVDAATTDRFECVPPPSNRQSFSPDSKSVNVTVPIHSASGRELMQALEQTQVEVYQLIANDTFLRFLHRVNVDAHVSLSKQVACWWRERDLTCARFFSFPSPINTTESRLHAIVNMLLVLVAWALDWRLAIP